MFRSSAQVKVPSDLKEIKPIATTRTKSGYLGVYPARKGRWQAQVNHKSIGGYPSAWEAGVAVTSHLVTMAKAGDEGGVELSSHTPHCLGAGIVPEPLDEPGDEDYEEDGRELPPPPPLVRAKPPRQPSRANLPVAFHAAPEAEQQPAPAPEVKLQATEPPPRKEAKQPRLLNADSIEIVQESISGDSAHGAALPAAVPAAETGSEGASCALSCSADHCSCEGTCMSVQVTSVIIVDGANKGCKRSLDGRPLHSGSAAQVKACV